MHFLTCVDTSPNGTRLASASADSTDKIWDARPWTPELKAEEEAMRLIRFHRAKPVVNDKVKDTLMTRMIPTLRAQPLTPVELRDAITADPTISEVVRQRALEMVRD